MEAECSVSPPRALEPTGVGMLLSTEYEWVFNKILLVERCDYLFVDCPTLTLHFEAGNGLQHWLVFNPPENVLSLQVF